MVGFKIIIICLVWFGLDDINHHPISCERAVGYYAVHCFVKSGELDGVFRNFLSLELNVVEVEVEVESGFLLLLVWK